MSAGGASKQQPDAVEASKRWPGKERKFTRLWQPTRLNGWNGVCREGEIHYIHSASLAHEDGIVFMYELCAARQ